jgi:O-antigen/teichoic acid export membrane protein
MNAILGWLLIPYLGIQGAAITASVAYVVIMIWQSLMFKRISGASWRVFRPFTGWK